MASGQNKKKNTKTQKRKAENKKAENRRKQQIKDHGIVQDEIILVVSLVVCVLLFLSNFGLIGWFGKAVSFAIFGLVGLEAYALPFVIFFGIAFHISNQGNTKAGRKILSAAVFLVALSSLIELITNHPYDEARQITDYFKQSSVLRNGGGFIGGIFVKIFCSLLDELGTYIILIAVMLITMIVITGKAIFTFIAKKSKDSFHERREYQKLKKEQQEAGQTLYPDQLEERRPPKTFVLGPDTSAGEPKAQETDVSMANLKVKRHRRERPEGIDDLPIVNLNHLFEDEPEEATPQERENRAPGHSDSVISYEEELRNKFGRPETNESIDIKDNYRSSDISIQKAASADPDAAICKTDAKEYEGEEKRGQGQTKASEEEKLTIDQTTEQKTYVFPPLNLLSAPRMKSSKAMTDKSLKETARKLQSTLESFGVHVTVTNVSCGPAVTRYELSPEQGVMVSKITRLADDIKLNLAASDIRIEAPIPGKAAVGIEVPNSENSVVTLREMLESREYTEHPSDLAFAVGRDIGGQIIITDIAKMPHLLIAGATGSGKSVCINTLIMSILYKSNPSDVRMIMIDPKVVELNVYNGIPHLLIPVVTDPKKASAALNWAVMEMTERYKKFADAGVRDLKGYNEKVGEVAYLNDENYQKLPQILIIIDELADLMMVAENEVEDAICRLAQLARAAGLHLIIATQRPSVNVITGLIKANIPSRIAFAVSSAVDSRTIIDGSGAEKLLGKGDMLFFPSGYPKPVRIQGAFISDKEVSSVTDYIKKHNNEAQYSEEIKEHIVNSRGAEGTFPGGSTNDQDEYFAEAGKFIIEKDKASIGMLQRVYKIGFNRAARIMDQLADAGVVGPEEGTKPRKILMSQEQFEQYLEEN